MYRCSTPSCSSSLSSPSRYCTNNSSLSSACVKSPLFPSAQKKDSISTSRLTEAVEKASLELFPDAVNADSQTVHRHPQPFSQSPSVLYPRALFPFVVRQDHFACLRRKQFGARIETRQLCFQLEVLGATLAQLDRVPGRMPMKWKRVDRRLISIWSTKVLVENIAGDSIEIGQEAVFADLSALCQLARDSIDGLVSKLEYWKAASAFEVLHEPAVDALVLFPRAIGV